MLRLLPLCVTFTPPFRNKKAEVLAKRQWLAVLKARSFEVEKRFHRDFPLKYANAAQRALGAPQVPLEVSLNRTYKKSNSIHETPVSLQICM
jgi:hypothetical protein